MSRQVKKVNISGKEDKSNKVNSWSNTTTDIHYPSEKLVKDSLDAKLDKTHTSYKGKNVVTNASTGTIEFEEKNNHTHSQYLTSHQDLSNYVTTDDSRLSDARTPTSHTHTKSQITDFPTIPSASSTVPSADTTNGSYGSGTSYARSNHTHPKSSLYAESSHTHSQYLTEHQSLSNYVQKSSTSGLLKNNGSVDTTQYLSSLPSHNHDDRYYTESEVDTALNGKANSSHTHSQYLTEHQDLSNYVTTDDSRLSDARTPTSHTHTKSQITDFPTIPSASSTVPSADTTNGSYGSGTSYARSNHTHPKSSLYAEASHTHSQYLTSHQDISSKEDSSNKVSSWNSTTNNIRYPTEKLVKDSLDGKADNNHTHDVLLSSNDDSDIQLFNVSAQGVPQGEGQSLGAFLSEFWKTIYPIGSIYMNTNNVDPAILFGGQWEQIEDKFLLASGTSYSNGATGGSADATLVSHQHGTSESGEYFVTSESNGANNTRVTYSSSGNRYVDGMTTSETPFHHRVGTGYVGVSATGKNMPPYLVVNVWKRIA